MIVPNKNCWIQKKDIIKLKVFIPLYIYLDNNANIDVCNGHNRFANLRNAGVKDIPFVIEKKDYFNFIIQNSK